MKLLADENVPLAAVLALRDGGLDVAWVGEIRTGLSDREVLQLAYEQDRILVTLDRDFGELIFLRDHTPPPAVVLIRAPIFHPILDLAFPIEDLFKREKIEGFFWVLGRDSWRRHPLPT